MVARFSGATGFPVPFEFLEISEANSSHSSATAPQTMKLIDGLSSLPLTCIDNVPFSFALQLSSLNSIGSSKNGMSTFTEIEHHNTSDIVPFSIWLVFVSSVPHLF